MKYGLLLLGVLTLFLNVLTFSNAYADDEVYQPGEVEQPSKPE